MAAVACVIQNRAASPGWWGRDLRGVCLAQLQFSCWNENDPQHDRMHAETVTGDAIVIARAIADIVLLGALGDFTHGADHYCTEAVADKTAWARGKTPVFTCDTHLFYRLGLGA